MTSNNVNPADDNRVNLNDDERDEVKGLEPNEDAQKLGGGKGEGKGVEIGNFGDDDFNKTDQSISQAAPGQTATFENQGGSD